MDHPSACNERLAVDGGRPVRSRPLPPWPHFDEEQIEAATSVLRSGRVNYWTGETGRAFEQEFAAAVGTQHAIAVANGTLALELALHALGIGPGDEVIVPCRTFVATGGAVALRGAAAVFADVDPVSQNITAETIKAVLTPRTRAVIVVHLAGWPCDMDPIMALAARHGLKVIEDCAQAHGATYQGRAIGSLGDMAAFSFCQDKIITTAGEGGMVTTNDSRLWEIAWSYKDHGKSWDAVYHRQHATAFRWLHESIGTNWRLTELQSAIGRVALQRLPAWVAARRRNADLLHAMLAQQPALRTDLPPDGFGHSYYKFYAFLNPELLKDGWTRDRVVFALQAEGIPCGSGTCPEIYLEKAFDGYPTRPAQRLPVAKELGETSLMFVVHPTLSDDDMRDTGRAVEKVLRAATVAQPASGRAAA